ncbi:hypothetical protein I4U23_005191 [Adineta vaga]|nr:hypothetical protein I4U23_005191 [Adineta vaga]
MTKIVFLTTNILPCIITFSYGFDLTSKSIVGCKLRQVLLFALSTITFTCTCLATIDHFFVICSNPSLHRMSSITEVYKIGTIINTIWFIHANSLLSLGYFASFQCICAPITTGTAIYVALFFIIVFSFIPITIIFRYLTCRNISETRAHVEQ